MREGGEREVLEDEARGKKESKGGALWQEKVVQISAITVGEELETT